MSLIDLRKTNTESPHTLRLLSFILQYTTAVNVLTNVATIAGAIIPAGFTLPYWLLYAIIFTGINCKEEIFKIKNVHISLLAPAFALPVPWAQKHPAFFRRICRLPPNTPDSPSPPPAPPSPSARLVSS